MTKTIPIKVQNEYIVGDKVPIGAAGSHNDVVLRLEFSPMWEGLTKTVQFQNALGETCTDITLTVNLLEGDSTNVYLVPVPYNAKKYAGDMALSIRGVSVSNARVTRATMAAYGEFTVYESKWDSAAQEDQDITPTQAEQLQAQIDEVLSTIVDARPAAEEAQAAAESAAASAAAAAASEASVSADAATASAAAAGAESSKETALEAADKAEEATKHAPGIGDDGKWKLWDIEQGKYVGTDFPAIATRWWPTTQTGMGGGQTAWAKPAGSTGYVDHPQKGDYLLNRATGDLYYVNASTETSSGGTYSWSYVKTIYGKDGSEAVYVDLTGSGDDLTASKTVAEIQAAYNNGDLVIARAGGALFPLYSVSEVGASFTGVVGSNVYTYSGTNPGGGGADIWALEIKPMLLRDTKYTDIGRKTVLGAIQELQNGSNGTLYITISGVTNFTADKTYTEIKAAYDAGMTLIVRTSNARSRIYQLKLAIFQDAVAVLWFGDVRTTSNDGLPEYNEVVYAYSNGEESWSVTDIRYLLTTDIIPTATADDAGKFLRVNSEGAYALESVPDANGTGF